MKKSTFVLFHWIMSALAMPAVLSRGAVTGSSVKLNDSIKEVADGASVSGPHRVREALTAAESTQSLNLVISLRMRNFDEFQSLLQSGRVMTPDQLEANY